MFRHYKQYDALTPREVSDQFQEQAAERRAQSLARVEPIDLSATTWPAYPPHAVVNAITYAARRGLHRYLDRHSVALRTALAHEVGVPEGRLVVGDGIAQLRRGRHAGAAGARRRARDPVAVLRPVPRRRAPRPRERGARRGLLGRHAAARRQRPHARHRAVQPQRPDRRADRRRCSCAELLDALPERVVVLLDEALRDFVDAEERDAALALAERFPRLLVFRTFSKAWGLAGLRCGYAIGGPESEPLLEQLEPELGVNELAQAGALEALRHADVVARRVAVVAEQRARIAAALPRPRRSRRPRARPTSCGCAPTASTAASWPSACSAAA